MKQIQRLCLVMCSLVFVTGAAADELKEFSSKDGKFKVLMPGKPKEQSQSVAGMEIKMFLVEEKNGGMVVVYCDMSVMGPPDAMLDGAVKGALANSKSKEKSVAKIQLVGKHPGREIV